MTRGTVSSRRNAGTSRDPRSSAVVRAATSGAGLKLVSIFAGLGAVALAVRHLGATPYGLLTTLTGVVLLLGFLDFGVGSAVIRRVAAAHALRQRNEMNQVATNAVVFLGLIGLLVATVALICVICLPDNAIPSGPGLTQADSRLSLAGFACFVGVGIPASVGGRLALGILKGYQNNLVQASGSIASLAGASIGVWENLGLPYFVAIFLAGPALAGLVQTARLFSGQNAQFKFQVKSLDARLIRAMLIEGIPFTGLVVAGAISLQTDTLVIGVVVSLSGAAAYGLLNRAFNALTTLLGSGLQQMWGSTSHALAVGDIRWVRRSFGRMFALTMAAYVVGAVLMTILGPSIVRVWSGNVVSTSFSLAIAFSCWNTYAFAMSQLSTLLNAAGVVKVQAVTAIIMACVNLPLSVYLAHQWGLSGPLWASLMAHGAIVGVPTLALSVRVLRAPSGAVSDTQRVGSGQ